MNFERDFILPSEIDLNFELSKRQSLDLKKIKKKIKDKKLEKIIIDISINGYSTKEEFDFECSGVTWKKAKKEFITGQDAQKDPEALTVKRAIRILSLSTTKYIEDKQVNTFLSKYNTELPVKYAHLGANYVVPAEHGNALMNLWKNFDKEKKTKTFESCEKILKIRFPGVF
jgi:hypothetical protein